MKITCLGILKKNWKMLYKQRTLPASAVGRVSICLGFRKEETLTFYLLHSINILFNRYMIFDNRPQFKNHCITLFVPLKGSINWTATGKSSECIVPPSSILCDLLCDFGCELYCDFNCELLCDFTFCTSEVNPLFTTRQGFKIKCQNNHIKYKSRGW